MGTHQLSKRPASRQVGALGGCGTAMHGRGSGHRGEGSSSSRVRGARYAVPAHAHAFFGSRYEPRLSSMSEPTVRLTYPPDQLGSAVPATAE